MSGAKAAASDPGILLSSLGFPLSPQEIDRISPWRFRAPVSPDLAAQREGRSIDVDSVVEYCQSALEQRREILLIFKEAIHNVVRHSGCTRTRVLFEYRDRRLLLEVRDNGRGFDGRSSEGNGIGNMRRRADAIRGQLEFSSAEGEGTILKLAVPLSGA